MKRTPLKRKTPLKPKRKWTAAPKILTIEEELDDLTRRIVLIRDKFKCRKCGKGIRSAPTGAVLQVHHIMTKGSAPSLRWELDNLLLVCKGCHFGTFHNRDSERARDWYHANLGENFLEQLRFLKKVRKGQKTDKGAVRFYLQQELERVMPRQAHPIEGWSERRPVVRNPKR
jgi:hypothetical protein